MTTEQDESQYEMMQEDPDDSNALVIELLFESNWFLESKMGPGA